MNPSTGEELNTMEEPAEAGESATATAPPPATRSARSRKAASAKAPAEKSTPAVAAAAAEVSEPASATASAPAAEPEEPAQPAGPSEPGEPGADTRSGFARYRVLAAVAIAFAAIFLIWLVVRDDGSSSSDGGSATFVSESQLKDLAASVKHPVFWVGPKNGLNYELSRTPNGAIFVRYLPDGVDAGAKGEYLTVATYPFKGAYAAIEKVAQQQGVTPTRLVDGGIAEGSGASSKSVHVAYPGVDYQAEVFDPTPGSSPLVRLRRLPHRR
jgi:hypothetical protein